LESKGGLCLMSYTKSESLNVGSAGTAFSKPSADSENLTVFLALLLV